MSEAAFVKELEAEILDTVRRCRSCMNCYTVCPLVESTRGFQTQGPHGIIRSIYYAIRWGEMSNESSEAIRDIVYLCSTCRSCEIKCKASAAGLPLVDIIEEGRKLLVEKMIGPLPDHIKVLESIEREGNPYEEPASARLGWLDTLRERGLHPKILPDDGTSEILLFPGCTASYNESIQETARALVSTLEAAGIDWGVLKDDRCCASPARRIGEEGLFQEISEKNLKTFKSCGVKHIVTISPHCYNTFVSEYPEDMAGIKVQHYTQFLADLLNDGKLKLEKEIKKTVTYHDPCYLGKRNEIYEEPRSVLQAVPGLSLVEMKRNRQDSLCCGGGGGRMWAEVEEIHRLGEIRLAEAEAAGADLIATACPWCHIQLEDAIKVKGMADSMQVKDIAEIVAESI